MRLYIEQQDLGEQDLTIGESPREQGGASLKAFRTIMRL